MSEYDDSFEGYSEAEVRGTFGGAKLTKFVNDVYTTREGEIISADRGLIAVGIEKRVQKFIGRKLISSLVVPPGERWPDVEQMNNDAPREEWGVDLNGNPAGPYVRVTLLKLVDLASLNRYVFITQSIGGNIAIGALADKVKIMRQFRGPGVVPEIRLDKTRFVTRFGVRNRPDFVVSKWIRFGGGDGGQPLPTPKPTPELPAAAVAPVANDNIQPTPAVAVNDVALSPGPTVTAVATPVQVAIETVTVPSLSEELRDQLPF
jgi:hypothetical protein